MSDPLLVACLVAAMGSWLVAGVFFAFTTTVMKSLQAIPATYGITAMQTINTTILNTRWVTVFMGATAASVLLAVTAPFTTDQPGAIARGVGGVVYLVFVFLVTVTANIPLNNALDELDPASEGAPARWEQFLRHWMVWHYVRTIAATAVAATLTLTLALQ